MTDLARRHEQARTRGVSRPLYACAHVLLTPVLRGWCALHVEGADVLRQGGAAIVAPNHKSLLDPLFVGMAAYPRPVRYLAKAELFSGPLGGVIVRLGAFPVRRGEHDTDALETARTLLERGEIVVVFPEGTRVTEADALGRPHHGAGRLAVATGAPVIPAAIAGTAHLWFGPLLKPRHVRVAFLPPLRPRAGTPASVAELVDDRLWPEVREEYGRLRAAPGVLLTLVGGLGLGAGWLARRGEPPRLLGTVEPLKRRRRSRWRRWRRRLRRG